MHCARDGSKFSELWRMQCAGVCRGAGARARCWMRGWMGVCGVVVVVAERAGVNNWSHCPFLDSYLQDFKVEVVGKYVVREHRDLVAVQIPSKSSPRSPHARTGVWVQAKKRRREREREKEKEREARNRVQQMQIGSSGRRGGGNERAENIKTVVSVSFFLMFFFRMHALC